MRESGYYPPGAEFDPNAPWNEPPEPDPIEVKADVCVSLVNTLTVDTTNYWIEQDCDGYKEFHHEDSYQDVERYIRETYTSIPDLLAELVKYIDKELESPELKRSRKWELQKMKESAIGWKECDFDIEHYNV